MYRRDVNDRWLQLKNIDDWYNHNGRRIIKELLENDVIDQIDKYRCVAQKANRKELSGVYQFSFCCDNIREIAYIGESGNVYFRLLEHMFNLFTYKTFWGIFPAEFNKYNIKIEWTVQVGISEDERKELEITRIYEKKPFLQYTDEESDEYGPDKEPYYVKEIKRYTKRDEIRPDNCVVPELERKRAKEIFSIP